MENSALDRATSGAAGAIAALRAEGLGKTYHGGAGQVVVFAQIGIEVHAGERVALTGESGVGKSTLLHLLGLLDQPTAGRVYYGPTEVTRLDAIGRANVRNREVGFVWQLNTLLPEFTALENVAMPLRIRGLSRCAAEQAAAERLREVGLTARLRHRAGELSGGEQQRVALARALITDPRLLLADEPTGSLDARTAGMVMDLLEEVHARRTLATLYVTHNSGFASRAHRVLELEAGGLASKR
ncbi:MAG: ABC transporter ATP-binding protein [Bryobacteraceae bacterium]